jgi:hypothetical protein
MPVMLRSFAPLLPVREGGGRRHKGKRVISCVYLTAFLFFLTFLK